MSPPALAQSALDEVTAKKTISIAIPTDFSPYGFVGTGLLPQGLAQWPWAQRGVAAYVQLFQGTPLLMQLFLACLGLALLGLNTLVETLAEEGMTLLMVTHEMNFARKVADRIVFLHAARIHQMGPPAAIFGDP